MFIEYPKALYKGGIEDCITVQDKEGETAAREDGYEMYAEIHARITGKHEDVAEPAIAEPAKRGRKPKAE